MDSVCHFDQYAHLYRGLIRKEYSQSWKIPRQLRSYGENSTPGYSEKLILLQQPQSGNNLTSSSREISALSLSGQS